MAEVYPESAAAGVHAAEFAFALQCAVGVDGEYYVGIGLAIEAVAFEDEFVVGNFVGHALQTKLHGCRFHLKVGISFGNRAVCLAVQLEFGIDGGHFGLAIVGSDVVLARIFAGQFLGGEVGHELGVVEVDGHEAGCHTRAVVRALTQEAGVSGDVKLNIGGVFSVRAIAHGVTLEDEFHTLDFVGHTAIQQVGSHGRDGQGCVALLGIAVGISVYLEHSLALGVVAEVAHVDLRLVGIVEVGSLEDDGVHGMCGIHGDVAAFVGGGVDARIARHVELLAVLAEDEGEVATA